ncbi:hypothetical protein AYI68_g2719 [Smittium mucronatum]|uniref:Carbohydrate-binding module family 19 domain-containing protein n=1 Tax=Smittium mucronatum TaxID=133383 RepID=A0A1R0H206_9FUNG|nr:hypothetical protein AYI68_g4793 [Smittium mucronatum]OLY83150.1 hypothetical protein AYI68_g2719 [Smittium mucronatum]
MKFGIVLTLAGLSVCLGDQNGYVSSAASYAGVYGSVLPTSDGTPTVNTYLSTRLVTRTIPGANTCTSDYNSVLPTDDCDSGDVDDSSDSNADDCDSGDVDDSSDSNTDDCDSGDVSDTSDSDDCDSGDVSDTSDSNTDDCESSDSDSSDYESSSSGECVAGSYQCVPGNPQAYLQCNFGQFLTRQCGPGTVCKDGGNGSIYCGFP